MRQTFIWKTANFFNTNMYLNHSPSIKFSLGGVKHLINKEYSIFIELKDFVKVRIEYAK